MASRLVPTMTSEAFSNPCLRLPTNLFTSKLGTNTGSIPDCDEQRAPILVARSISRSVRKRGHDFFAWTPVAENTLACFLSHKAPLPDEKAALVVDEQLVKFGYHRSGNAQPLYGALNNTIKCLGPMFAANGDAARLDLPCAANLRVDDGLRAAAVRRTRRGLDQLFCLRR